MVNTVSLNFQYMFKLNNSEKGIHSTKLGTKSQPKYLFFTLLANFYHVLPKVGGCICSLSGIIKFAIAIGLLQMSKLWNFFKTLFMLMESG